jgi:hypothetical protein
MAGEKHVWDREFTLGLISVYEAHPEMWDTRHRDYKDREKRNLCWQLMAEETNTSVAEVQRKIHNLRNQVVYCMYYVLCVKCLICTLHYVRERTKCRAEHVCVW